MTVSQGQPAQPVDPLASQRAELLGKLLGAQFALERALAALRSAGGDVGELSAQLADIGALQSQVSTADRANLAAMASAVASAAAQSQQLAAQGDASATSARSENAASLATTVRDCRAAMQSAAHDIYESKILDPYLTFASEEDEKAYRKRERENWLAYERERAKHTPEGDLRAAELLRAQLDDAKAHGADQSPDYARIDATVSAAEAGLARVVKVAEVARPSRDVKLADQSGGGAPDNFDAVLVAFKTAGVTTLASATTAEGHGLKTGLQTTTDEAALPRSFS